jgi:hypothetical protein
MKRSTQLIAFFLITLIVSGINLFAQESENKPSLDDGTIEDQFNYVITKSNRYE